MFLLTGPRKPGRLHKTVQSPREGKPRKGIRKKIVISAGERKNLVRVAVLRVLREAKKANRVFSTRNEFVEEVLNAPEITGKFSIGILHDFVREVEREGVAIPKATGTQMFKKKE